MKQLPYSWFHKQLKIIANKHLVALSILVMFFSTMQEITPCAKKQSGYTKLIGCLLQKIMELIIELSFQKN